jgi:hypothetical protein
VPVRYHHGSGSLACSNPTGWWGISTPAQSLEQSCQCPWETWLSRTQRSTPPVSQATFPLYCKSPMPPLFSC